MGIKEYILIAIAVALFGVGMLFGFKWQAARLATCSAGLQTALADNKSDIATINLLKSQVANGNSLCQKRLAEKDIIINKLTALLNVEVKENVKENVTSSGNSYLDALNGMFPKDGAKGYACTDSSSKSPSGTPNGSGGLLCFNSYQDAVALIRNITLLDGDRKDCRDIVSSLTNTKGDK